MSAFPSDVLVVEPRGILFTRFQRNKEAEITAVSRIPLPEGLFEPGSISPLLADPVPFVDALRRLSTNRKIDGVSVLLPDSWFRLHLLSLDSIPERRAEADQVVRWSLRRALPGRSEELRLAWQVIERTGKGGRVAVLASTQDAMTRIEKAIETAGMDAALIEPIGISLWNALANRIPSDGAERLLMVARETDLALLLFRGERPLFYRSKRISPQTDLVQEVRLSSSYLKNQVGIGTLTACWTAGERIDESVRAAIQNELAVTPRPVTLPDVGLRPGAIDVRGEEIAIAAALGVFAA